MQKRIEVASWPRFLIPLAVLVAYSAWAFRDGGQFANALAAAGKLPEMIPGFPEGIAAKAYEKLAAAGLVNDYIRFQLIDIPYAVFNFLTLFSLIALALKQFNLGATPLRFTLLLPGLYLFAEFIEDPLLSVLAGGGGEPAALIPLQQAMTTLKFGALTPSIGIALILLAALAIDALMRFFKKSA